MLRNTYNTFVSDDEYRQNTHTAEVPSLRETWPDQWVDWGDVTVQIDPIGNKQWIHDSHDGHARSERRGRQYDAEQVRHLKGWEESHYAQNVSYYVPTFSQIEGVNKFPAPYDDAWRGVARQKASGRPGKLPAVTALLRDVQLGNKSIGDIEREIHNAERTVGHRLFDKTDTIISQG